MKNVEKDDLERRRPVQRPPIQPFKPTVKQLVVGLLLTLPFGLAAPGLIPFLPLGPALAFLYAYGGIAPFLVCAFLQIVVYDMLGGIPAVAVWLLASLLPGAFAVRGMRWQRPFATQVKTCLTVQLIGIVAAVAFLYLQVGEIIARLMEYLRVQMANYPGEMLEMLLAGRFESVDELMNVLENNLTLQLPGMLISAGIASGALMAALPNWLLRRRGQADPRCYVSMAGWRVPGSVTAGVLTLLAAGIVLYRAGMRGGDSVFVAVRSLCDCCFIIQGLGAIARFSAKIPMPRVWRNVFLALSVTLVQTVAVYLGCFSALFGSRGLVTGLLLKYRKKNDE